VFTALFLCTLLAIDLAVVCFAFGYMSGYRRAFAERAMTQTY
jgi:hypothetical protein